MKSTSAQGNSKGVHFLKEMKDPAVLFYTSDFLIGTSFFTDEQTGQYIKLLCLQHQHGAIPKEHMLNICKSYDNPVYSKFIQDERGNYFNKRMRIEADKRSNYCKSRVNNKKSGKNENNKMTYDDTYVEHMGNENINKDIIKKEKESINNISVYEFQDFWNDYEKKGNKKTAETLYKKISEANRELIKNHVKRYVISTPEKRFRKDAERYLRNNCWEDEIETNNYDKNKPKTPPTNSHNPEDYLPLHVRKHIEEREKLMDMAMAMDNDNDNEDDN